MLGLRRKTVKLVPHDSAWADLFQEEEQRLEKAFGDTVIAIEHVGSTAIPGMPAKPILDMNIGVESLEVARGMDGTFATLDYEHRSFKEGHTDEVLRQQELFIKGPDSNSTHNAHVTVYGGEYWNKDLHFRDYLRAHPDCARDYAELKEWLAREHAADRNAYMLGKTEFIREVLQVAERYPS